MPQICPQCQWSINTQDGNLPCGGKEAECPYKQQTLTLHESQTFTPVTPTSSKRQWGRVLLPTALVLSLIVNGMLVYYTIRLNSQTETYAPDNQSLRSTIQALYATQTSSAQQLSSLQAAVTADAGTAQALTSGMPKAKAIAQTVPPPVHPGETLDLFFELENIGTSTWSSQEHYMLTCVADCMGLESVSLDSSLVAPKASYRFNLHFTAPSVQGTYYTGWQLQYKGNPVRLYNKSICDETHRCYDLYIRVIVN